MWVHGRGQSGYSVLCEVGGYNIATFQTSPLFPLITEADMLFSRYIFKAIVSLPFILFFNALLIAFLFVLVDEGLHVECVTMIKRLRLETLSTLLVVWGVILESREIILSRLATGKRNSLSEATHHDIELYGISLVALGLIVEVIDYVNNQFQADEFNFLALEVTALIQWIVLVIVLLDTCGLSTKIIAGLWKQRKQMR